MLLVAYEEPATYETKKTFRIFKEQLVLKFIFTGRTTFGNSEGNQYYINISDFVKR
jgi:hypothetical protein